MVLLRVTAAALACLLADPGGRSLEQPPGIPEAMRVQAQDPAAAAKILEGVTSREPENARAWRLLGLARQQAKQFDAALAAYRKAIALEADPTTLYNSGVVYALKGDAERAFEWLLKAKAARADMSVLEVDANVQALRSDRRFRELLPKPDDFRNPFVEETRILHEWMGQASNDQFGWIARSIGDVDGDGVHDVVASAPGHAAAGAGAGRIYVYSARSGKELWKADGAAGDRLGTTVEAAGDTNRDGIPDVAATGGGRVRVYSGRDGTLLRTITSPGSLPLVAVAGAGDVNTDGFADLIAGSAPVPAGAQGGAAPVSAPGAGSAYIFSGKDAALLHTFSGEREGDRFGAAVAGPPPGEQILLVVGAPGAGLSKSGRVYVYRSLEARPAFVIEANESGVALGAMFVAVAGDADGDGTLDAYASDFADRARGPATGRIYVHSGKDGRRLLTLTGEAAGAGFGTSPSHAGDVDGDGHADFAIGAWQYAGAAVSGGRIYLHSGKDGRLLRTITGRIPGDTLGFDSVGIGDVDEDGTVDLLVTAAYSGINGYRSGRVFIVSSGIRR